MHLKEDGSHGQVIRELRPNVIAQAVRAIEQERERRRGGSPTTARRQRKVVDSSGLHAAFARAAREQEQLRQLKASGKQWACLDFQPELPDSSTQVVLDATPARVAVPGGLDANVAGDGAADASALAAAR
jgi:hypothetical protein